MNLKSFLMKKLLWLFFSASLLTSCTQPSTNKTELVKDSVATTTASSFKSANVDEQAIYSRAFNAVIWGMPAVNFELFIEALTKANGNFNQVVYWGGLSNSKNQTLT